MLMLYCRMQTWAAEMKRRLREEKGSLWVDILIFIAIALGIAFIFRNRISALLGSVFDSSDQAVKDLSAGSITN